MMVELAAGEIIGDIGCGPGHVASYLANRGARVVGLDLSPAMCSVGSAGNLAAVRAADMTALPIRSQGLGAIVSLYAVIHLEASGREAAYREFARALRPGGHALIAFHTCDAETPSGGRENAHGLVGSRRRAELPIPRSIAGDRVAGCSRVGPCGAPGPCALRRNRAPEPSFVPARPSAHLPA